MSFDNWHTTPEGLLLEMIASRSDSAVVKAGWCPYPFLDRRGHVVLYSMGEISSMSSYCRAHWKGPVKPLLLTKAVLAMITLGGYDALADWLGAEDLL